MFAVGSDPEVFITDHNGNLKSAIGTVGGTKKFPRSIDYCKVQEDNVLLEFNTDPASTCEDFVRNHVNAMQSISALKEMEPYRIDIRATGYMPEGELSHPKARIAGCEPDYNAWKMGINNPPDLSATNLRSAAGHLHISTDWMGNRRNREGAVERCELVKALDIALGIPSVLMDDDTTRRELYGKAGCHRPKFSSVKGTPYDGVEYRTLSNFWLRSEELMRWAYDNVEHAIYMLNHWNRQLDNDTDLADEVQRVINESDAGGAIDLVDFFDLEVVIDGV